MPHGDLKWLDDKNFWMAIKKFIIDFGMRLDKPLLKTQWKNIE